MTNYERLRKAAALCGQAAESLDRAAHRMSDPVGDYQMRLARMGIEAAQSYMEEAFALADSALREPLPFK